MLFTHSDSLLDISRELDATRPSIFSADICSAERPAAQNRSRHRVYKDLGLFWVYGREACRTSFVQPSNVHGFCWQRVNWSPANRTAFFGGLFVSASLEMRAV